MLFSIVLLFTVGAMAQHQEQGGFDPCYDSQEVQDVFGCETDEFDFERFDDESILMAINRDARIACNSAGLCQISSVTSRDRRFTASFMVGEGNPLGGLNGGGTNIILPADGGINGETRPYYGLNLSYSTGRCTQTVNVPRSGASTTV